MKSRTEVEHFAAVSVVAQAAVALGLVQCLTNSVGSVEAVVASPLVVVKALSAVWGPVGLRLFLPLPLRPRSFYRVRSEAAPSIAALPWLLVTSSRSHRTRQIEARALEEHVSGHAGGLGSPPPMHCAAGVTAYCCVG
eukprot:2130649-Amphidinium_carterae.1